jgi:hypothetical protein
MRSREGALAAQAACSAGNRADSSVAVDSAGQSGEDGDMLLQPRQCSSNELTEPSGKKEENYSICKIGNKRERGCEGASHMLNMEFIWAPFVQLYLVAETP